MEYKTIELEKEYTDPRQFDWRLKWVLQFIDEILFALFGYRITITCLGRDKNTGDKISAHFTENKIVAAADIRSRDMTIKMFTVLERLDKILGRYGDIIIEDERFNEKWKDKPPHIHIEINPDYWMSLKGMI